MIWSLERKYLDNSSWAAIRSFWVSSWLKGLLYYIALLSWVWFILSCECWDFQGAESPVMQYRWLAELLFYLKIKTHLGRERYVLCRTRLKCAASLWLLGIERALGSCCSCGANLFLLQFLLLCKAIQKPITDSQSPRYETQWPNNRFQGNGTDPNLVKGSEPSMFSPEYIWHVVIKTQSKAITYYVQVSLYLPI